MDVPGPTFSTALKTSSDYLDVAANTHGEEKAFLMLEALRRIRHHSPHLVEVGPGGGSAIAYLASQFSSIPLPDDVRLTLVEAPGVTSVALDEAMHAFNRAPPLTCRTGISPSTLLRHLIWTIRPGEGPVGGALRWIGCKAGADATAPEETAAPIGRG
ncbi:hypothetical protein GCM10009757_29350 [Streptomyces cheonanensis]|uniref:Uncharacterized protein n=1 Tax=Streptomyces cheonanensis TaxID=312720 RepID=A0ABN2V850_9ACTN